MKPTICRCCGEPMPVQTEGNVNMCEDCKVVYRRIEDSFYDAKDAAIRSIMDSIETALKCIDDGNYHLAHVVLRDQLEKLNYEPTKREN